LEAVVEEPVDTEETEEELSPWYYFFSQGCGWCKKATPVVEELLSDGHDILLLDLAEPDNQKLNQELQQEYNTKCGTPWFINAETGKGVCGFREKDMLEVWLDGKDVPEPPPPTGPPPKVPFMGSTGKEETAWKKEYAKWLNDNSHMPENWGS
jgi:thiol-disulfide isomerase/thioredoxin